MINWGDSKEFYPILDGGGGGQAMTKGKREKLLKIISTEINAVKKLLAVLEESAKLLPSEDSGRRPSLGEMIQTKSADERELRAAQLRLNKLECALKKIDDPEFGICFICEQAIPLARLMEMPEITRCMKCEDK